MKHYLYYCNETGEEFIVGANSKKDSYEVACNYFLNPHYQCELTEFEAEASGLDEY